MQDGQQTCDFANRAGVAAASLGSPGIGGSCFGQLGSGLGLSMGGMGNAAGAPAIAQLGNNLSSEFSSLSADALGMRQSSFGGHAQPPPPPLPPGQPGGSTFGGSEKGAAILALAQQQQQQAHHSHASQQAHASQPGGGQLPAGSSLLSGHGERQGDSLGEQTVIPNLASYIHINSSLQLFSQQPGLKRVVPVAIDRAIREIISPVVERSVTISCVTTRELMLKDFAMEPDELRMRKAAQQMAQNLAGSLALVTCKEMLRVACSNHLRSLLGQAGAADSQLMEQVVQVCAADNLDLGCTLIEKAATEKAVRDVEEALAPAFAIRRKHREQTGLPYYDMSIFTSGRYPASLPEALRPKPGGLLPAQRRVYDDFGRIPRVTPSMGQPSGQVGGNAPPPPPPSGQGGGAYASSGGSGLLGSGILLSGGAHGADSLGFNRGTPTSSPLRSASSGPEGALGMQSSIPGLSAGTIGGGTSMLGVGQGSLHAQGGGFQSGESVSVAHALERLAYITSKLDMHALQLSVAGVSSVASLPADHEVFALLRQVRAGMKDVSVLALLNK